MINNKRSFSQCKEHICSSHQQCDSCRVITCFIPVCTLKRPTVGLHRPPYQYPSRKGWVMVRKGCPMVHKGCVQGAPWCISKASWYLIGQYSPCLMSMFSQHVYQTAMKQVITLHESHCWWEEQMCSLHWLNDSLLLIMQSLWTFYRTS